MTPSGRTMNEPQQLCRRDVFDALIHDRPYKSAWPVEKAVAEIESLSGTHFDPEVVSAFVEIVSSGELDGVLSD